MKHVHFNRQNTAGWSAIFLAITISVNFPYKPFIYPQQNRTPPIDSVYSIRILCID